MMSKLNSNELLELIGMVGLRIKENTEAMSELITAEAKVIVSKRIVELSEIQRKLSLQLKNK